MSQAGHHAVDGVINQPDGLGVELAGVVDGDQRFFLFLGRCFECSGTIFLCSYRFFLGFRCLALGFGFLIFGFRRRF